MNKTDRMKIAADFSHVNVYANQLANIVYNLAQTSENEEQRASFGETVRKYDAARNHFRQTLKQFDIIRDDKS